MQQILVPTDFTARAKRAVDYALALAKQHGARIHLLHVAVLPPKLLMDLSYAPGSEALLSLRRESEDALHREAEVIEGSGVRCVIAVGDGSVDGAVSDYVDANMIDLGVIGTRRASRLARLVFASTSDRILKKVWRPIVVVPPKASHGGGSIVVAYDFSNSAKRSVLLARALQGSGPGTLHVVHSVSDARRAKSERALAALIQNQVLGVAPFDNNLIQVHPVADPVCGALRVARDVDAALICAGTDGTAHSKRALGTVARRLLAESHLPVLLACDT